jgi:hypothetical protein
MQPPPKLPVARGLLLCISEPVKAPTTSASEVARPTGDSEGHLSLKAAYGNIPGCCPFVSILLVFTAWIRNVALPRTAIAGFVYVMVFTSFLSEDALLYMQPLPKLAVARVLLLLLCVQSQLRLQRPLRLRWPPDRPMSRKTTST